MEYRETELALLVADLAGFARATAGLEATRVAAFADDWYRSCATTVRAAGGRVVKYMGDACLAVFPGDACAAAVDAAHELRRALEPVRAAHGLEVELGVNVHVALVAEGELGPDDDRRYDVLGAGVNDLFRMGGGPGIRISDAVSARLPGERRR
jgi:class 3 adenylate cyclase